MMAKRVLCVLLCLLLLAGCAGSASTAPQSVPAPDSVVSPVDVPTPDGQAAASPDDQIYRLYTFENTYLFAADGRRLTEEETDSPLYDIETRKEQYRLRTRSEDTGEDDEYGNPVIVEYSALYSTDGTLLYDWEPINYQPAMGTLLIRQDDRNWWISPVELEEDYQTALWNPATGENVLDGVASVQSMGDEAFLANDAYGRALGVIDREGNILSGFPAPKDYYYPTTEHGVITADNHNPYGPNDGSEKPKSEFLLDRNFNVLLEKDYFNLGYIGLRGPYLLYGEGERDGILSLPGLEELYTVTEDMVDIHYFDGERMILQRGPRDRWRSWLTDAKGNAITEEFESLHPIERGIDGDEAPSTRFLAVNGDQALMLDRDGKVLVSATLPGLANISMIGNELYSYEVELPPALQSDGGSYRMGLLGPDFEVLLAADQYESIYSLRQYSGYHASETGLLQAIHTLPTNTSRTDLLDRTGKAIVTNISQIGDVGPDRIAVMRGFSMGLIDYHGNWIEKHSVYDSLRDD